MNKGFPFNFEFETVYLDEMHSDLSVVNGYIGYIYNKIGGLRLFVEPDTPVDQLQDRVKFYVAKQRAERILAGLPEPEPKPTDKIGKVFDTRPPQSDN